MGAGAVGCYYGGMLARAGHDVTLIARAQHVEVVRKGGLRMETKTFDANVPVQASAGTVKANVKDVRSEIQEGALKLYLTYDFSAERK